MSKFINFCGLIMLATLMPSVNAADSQLTTIPLGGARNAQCSVLADQREYTITAEMIPVQVFDDATNRAVNRQILTSIAFGALRRFLSDQPASLKVSGAEVGDVRSAGKMCRLMVKVPVAGVEVGPPPTHQMSELEEAATRAGIPECSQGARPHLGLITAILNAPQSGLLERKQEYLDLIQHLADVLQKDVPSPSIAAQDKSGPSVEADPMAMRHRVSVVFETLTRQIDNDLMLLSFEKQSLLDELGAQERKLQRAIGAASSLDRNQSVGEKP